MDGSLNKGFSLVELAVVLVIMGFLLGGALAGKELVHSSEIKAVISEATTYKVAIDNFNIQYEALPGDMKNAASFWTTTNGNGDGKIGVGTVGDDTEIYDAWQQLALAKIIPDTYSGSGTAAVIGTNVPASKHRKSIGFSVTYLAAPFAYADALSRNFPGNYIVLGANHATDNYLSTSGLVVNDAFQIDEKVDEGTPDFGKVLGGNTNCTTGSAPNIEYNHTDVAVSCILMFAVE